MMIKEINGLIEELCLYPEYEFMTPLLDERINPLDGGSYMPDIISFKDAPAFLYRSWIEEHELSKDLVIFRVVVVSPRHKHLDDKLVSEMVTNRGVLDLSTAVLEIFTLKALEHIKV